MTFEADELTQHIEALYNYSLGVTRDPELAAETVQDALVRALEKREQYRSDAPLRHWLIRIAHNLMIDRARKAKHEIVVEEIEDQWHDDDYSVNAETIVELAATRADLLDALVRLPFIYRSAVVLHDVEGLRVADIAEIHEVSLAAAKQRLRRGRMAMVSALADSDARRHSLKGIPMSCWDARQHISEYMNGDLAATTASEVEEHLEACPTCPPLYASMVGVHDELGRLRDPDSVIDPTIERRVRRILDSSGD